jgi:hypothetical protein
VTQSRQFAAATLLRSGKVLVVGGCTGTLGCASMEIYDPATNAWTPAAALLAARAYYHTSTLLKNGQVPIAGGTAARTGNFPTSAELYDPVQNTFAKTGSMHAARAGHTASLLTSGDVLAAGGFLGRLGTGSAEIYTPSTGLWATTGAMHVSRQGHTASVLPSGAVLVAGGEYYCDSDEGICFATNAVETYDEHSGAWTRTYGMLSARENHGAALLNNGGVLGAGGDPGGNPGVVWSSAEQFVPQRWTGGRAGRQNRRCLVLAQV